MCLYVYNAGEKDLCVLVCLFLFLLVYLELHSLISMSASCAISVGCHSNTPLPPEDALVHAIVSSMVSL